MGITIPTMMHGKSLLPLISEQKEKIRDYAYCGYYGRAWNIRNHEWSFHLYAPDPKLLPKEPLSCEFLPTAGTMDSLRDSLSWIINENPDKPFRQPEIYNVKDDPGENQNLIQEKPQAADILELELRRFVNSLL